MTKSMDDEQVVVLHDSHEKENSPLYPSSPPHQLPAGLELEKAPLDNEGSNFDLMGSIDTSSDSTAEDSDPSFNFVTSDEDANEPEELKPGLEEAPSENEGEEGEASKSEGRGQVDVPVENAEDTNDSTKDSKKESEEEELQGPAAEETVLHVVEATVCEEDEPKEEGGNPKELKKEFSFSFNEEEDERIISGGQEEKVKGFKHMDSLRTLRPCIKKSYSQDDIPVCVRRKSWRTLPKPDLDYVRQLSAPLPVTDLVVIEESGVDDGSSSSAVKGELEPESCAKTSTDVKPTLPKRKQCVQFDTVNIRNYDQTIGDNPSVSIGPPIQLDWSYEAVDPINVDEYEGARGPRRKLRNMVMSYYHRKNVLSYVFGHTEEELKRAEKDANRAKFSRSITRTFLPVQKVEEALESAGRKSKRYMKNRRQAQAV